MTEEYASMTVAQLKELLKEQGLPVSGKKAELIERLMEASGADEEVVEEAPAETSTDYSSMTVAQLKELLKEAGKPVSGKKAELIERLQE